MHSAGGYQGSRKAHPAGNKKRVTKLKSEYVGRGVNYFLELLGHHYNNINKDHQQCPPSPAVNSGTTNLYPGQGTTPAYKQCNERKS